MLVQAGGLVSAKGGARFVDIDKLVLQILPPDGPGPIPFRGMSVSTIDARWGIQLKGHHIISWPPPTLAVITSSNGCRGWQLHRELMIMAIHPSVFAMVSIPLHGRVVIPKELRRSDAPQPGETVLLMGQGCFLEIWPEVEWMERFKSRSTPAEDDLARKLLSLKR